ncbi:MAG: ABC transporter ATP-binding protein/permease [Olsenella sp.]|nr:ABC transporter ATP-binding protein/permease [Olsenella sp.]
MRGDSRRVVWRLLGLTRPMAGVMLLAIACGVLGFCCATFLPVVATRFALDALAGSLPPMGVVAGALVGLAVARGALHYAEQTCNHYIAFKLLAHVRDLVFGKLRELAPAKLAGHDRGSLVSTITSDVELLEVFFAHTISPVSIAVVMAVVMTAFLAGISPRVALVALVGYLCVGVGMPLLGAHLSADAGRVTRAQAGLLSGIVLDSLRGLSQVLQFGAGDARMSLIDDESRRLSDAQGRLSSASSTVAAASGALIMLFSLAVMLLGGSLVASGEMTVDGMAIATVAVMGSFGPFVALANLGTTLQGTIASGARILAILDEEPAVAEVTDGEDIEFSGASAHGVGFSYDGEEVLDNVSLEVPQGKVVGIEGKSGSGKSTLCRLFMRFWDVERGSIALSGTRVDAINTRSLRASEGLVEQDTFLFHGSIRDNLLVARPDATQEQIEAACRAASVHDFIEGLPKGYDTMVGELGDTLSGGERQRLGLARAFLHDAPFLILDEPTSNLDSLNEGVVLRSIARLHGSRTVLLVSHRPSTMAVADQTYSMDSGRVS